MVTSNFVYNRFFDSGYAGKPRWQNDSKDCRDSHARMVEQDWRCIAVHFHLQYDLQHFSILQRTVTYYQSRNNQKFSNLSIHTAIGAQGIKHDWQYHTHF